MTDQNYFVQYSFVEQSQAFHILIRKLISNLESIEKLPLIIYDTPSNYGLQYF
jgi:hypothetical protein